LTGRLVTVADVSEEHRDPFVEPAVPGEKPDAFKAWVHRVCGFIFGSLIGFWIAATEVEVQTGRELLLYTLLGGCLGGLIAGRQLDRFWESWCDWLRNR
jgi:hypothetical protein